MWGRNGTFRKLIWRCCATINGGYDLTMFLIFVPSQLALPHSNAHLQRFMEKVMKKFIALIASALMLAAGAAFAQKAETPKAAPAAPAPAAKAAPAAAAPAAPAAPATKADAKKDPLDINTASKDELKALPGVGDAYADKIIKARGKKGFGGKDELKKVLPEKTYDGIKDMIIAKQMKKDDAKSDAKKDAKK
jgi:competence protein ComEA